MRVALIGATSKTGRFLAPRLVNDGHDLVAIGRDAARLQARVPDAEHRVADFSDPATVAKSLDGIEVVVSLAHARTISTLLAALPQSVRRMVVTGSTRKFTRLPDPAADEVRAGEAAWRAFRDRGAAQGGCEAVLLHPSMIYGAPEDRSVGTILRAFRKWPRWMPAPVPLPAGGRHTVQPVFVDDVVAAFAAAVTVEHVPAEPIILAGPAPIPYREMVRTCAAAVGRRVAVVPVPVGLGAGVLGGLAKVGLRLPVSAAALRRTAEDKAFDVSPMIDGLGVTPRDFASGVAEKVRRGWL